MSKSNLIHQLPTIGGDIIRDTELYTVTDNSVLSSLIVSTTILYGKKTIGHRHKGIDEVYIILDGVGEIELDGEILPIKEGTLIILPEGIFHRLWNKGKDPLVALCVFQKYKREN